MPHASTRMRTSRRPGSGTSRSTSSNAPLGREIWTALIFGTGDSSLFLAAFLAWPAGPG
jgi:hypothetical protein